LPTRRCIERWPDHAPYGDAHDDAVPHLTIGQDAGVDVLRRAATAVERELPIHQRVESVHLLTGSDEEGSWETLRAFPLAAHVEGEATLRRP
jgi:2'-5' RNA ligase